MPNITIDGKEYDLEELSDDSKAQLISLQFVDAEIRRLQAQTAAYQTARIAYSRALKQLEEGTSPKEDEISVEGLGENLEFDDD